MSSFPLSSRFARIFWPLLLLVACTKYDQTVWKEDFPSPDGRWIATAAAFQRGGFGTAAITTGVDLRRSGETAKVNVLGLNCSGPMNRPYVLDNSANRGGSVDLKIIWLDATHLRLTFRNYPGVVHTVSQLDEVSISAEELSGR
jgi:hypothetical protein